MPKQMVMSIGIPVNAAARAIDDNAISEIARQVIVIGCKRPSASYDRQRQYVRIVR